MNKQHSLKNHLRKLSSSRIPSKKNLSSGPPNQTSSLFGPKNVVVTYSKTRPIQLMKKKHFHTPDTPQVLTPDDLQTAERKTDDTISEKLKPISQGGSYTSGKTLTSLEASSLQINNKLGTSVRSTTLPSNSGMKSIKQSSNLALRNISNIPIEKTLSRTQCTPNRSDARKGYLDTGSSSLQKSTKRTPISWKKRKELIKKTKDCKALEEDRNEPQNHCQEKPKTTMKSSLNKACSILHSNETNYSIKSMSYCTTASSRATSKQAHTGTLTLKSMSLCTTLTNDPNIGPKPVALGPIDDTQDLLPKNSTFDESIEQVMVQDFFSKQDHLSPIKDQDGSISTSTSPSVKQEELQKNTSSSDKFGNPPSQNAEAQTTNSCASYHQNTNSNNALDNNLPKTSTPTEQGKLPAKLEVDVSTILQSPDDKKETGVKRNSTRNVCQGNSLTSYDKVNSAIFDHKGKKGNHKTKMTQNLVQDLKEKSKPSLPLQASICLEDDSDPEQTQDNITPELMKPNKPCPSSSKRKLDYGGALNRHDKNVCFLLDLKQRRKRTCKLWMRSESPCGANDEEISVPQDVLAIT